MLRKVTLSFIAVYFKFDVQSQGLLGLSICIAALVAHEKAQPFVATEVNSLESLSLWNSLLTFLTGQFSFSSAASKRATFWAGVGALCINASFYVLVLFVAVRRMCQDRQQQALLNRELKDSADREENVVELTHIRPSPALDIIPSV